MKSWQYTGIATFDEITTWCTDKFGPSEDHKASWYWTWETIFFHHSEDYTAFLLRWA